MCFVSKMCLSTLLLIDLFTLCSRRLLLFLEIKKGIYDKVVFIESGLLTGQMIFTLNQTRRHCQVRNGVRNGEWTSGLEKDSAQYSLNFVLID